VLGWLETMAADTQIIYVTDSPAVIGWASRRQPGRVGVMSGSGFFGTVGSVGALGSTV
jgi:hypothetical protein